MTTDPIKAEAERRHLSHLNHPTHRPLSEDYELVGLRGEEALADAFGAAVDFTPRPGGDGGKDMALTLRCRDGEIQTFVLDAKTAKKPYHLIVEEGKVVQTTIYVLIGYIKQEDCASLLGWEWGHTLYRAPVRDFGYGVRNHHIARGRLREIEELIERCHK